MSKIVLCETKPAKVPYKIAKIGRSFQSYEEFCWLLEHYLIFFLTEGFEYPLKNYLKEQLDIVIKSDDVVQQVKEVINYYNYFTSDEKIQFQQKLRTTYLYSAAKKQKLLADMYLKHQLYVRALIAYQKLETVSGKLNAAEQIQVLYHMGLCQSRMFCFEEAKESFAMALRIKEDKQIQEAYFTAAYLAGDEEAFLEAGRRISFDEDQCKMIYQNIKEREKEVLHALLFSDKDVQDIAESLFISRAALYRHISSINQKTNTNKRVGIIQYYYAWNPVENE